jgi:hypothetical protein
MRRVWRSTERWYRDGRCKSASARQSKLSTYSTDCAKHNCSARRLSYVEKESSWERIAVKERSDGEVVRRRVSRSDGQEVYGSE